MSLRVEKLSFAYGRRRVLDQVSLEVAKGRFTAILGPNGSGKSTLLKLMAGILPCPSGTIAVQGRDLSSLPGRDRARLVGYLPQQHKAVFPFLVHEVVLTGRAGHAGLNPRAADRRAAAQAMERVGITGLADRPYSQLSGGEQQMVMLSRLLAQGPEIILLDEPTAHLDYANQARVLGLARGLLEQGYTVLAVLHDPNLALLYADEILLFKDGCNVALEDRKQAWDPDVLGRIYGMRLQGLATGARNLVFPDTDLAPDQ
jgi:iron complex transport system ATP-binding protein